MEEVRWRVRARAAVVALAAAFIVGGPLYRQVLGGREPALREWRMYGTRAVRSCRVEAERRWDGGPWRPFSSVAFLVARGQTPPTTIADEADVRALGRRLCALHEGDPRVAIRARWRCGHVRRGWGAWETSGDLCRPGGPR